MRVVLTMAIKDLKLLLRDKTAFFFAFFFPLVYATFFGSIFSGGGGDGSNSMSVLLVDQDRTDGSRAFIELLQKAPELDLVEAELETAREKVRTGSQTAYLLVPEGFGQASENRFSGQTPRVQIGVDPKRKAEEGMLQGILTKYAAQEMQRVFQDPAAMDSQMSSAKAYAANAPAQVRDSLDRLFTEIQNLSAFPGNPEGGAGFDMTPLELESVPVVAEWKGPRNAYSISFPQGIIWGIMGSAAGFGISLVIERQRGTLVRMQAAPVSRTQILGGKALACFFTTTSLAIVLLLLGAAVFGVRASSLLHLVMAIGSVATAFVGIMMLLSVMGKTEQAAGGIGWAVLMMMAMIGGGMIPLFFMPPWLQTFSNISPIKWSILAMEGALWRGFSLGEMMLPCLILLGTGIACFAVGVRSFRWSVEG